VSSFDISSIHAFLPCATPDAWVEAALEAQDVLLIDHANCEKKAASTALNLLYRYTDDFALLDKLSRLAREEMLHPTGRSAPRATRRGCTSRSGAANLAGASTR
jgi:tRNA-(ms[2]io[6]A)-hydroxylase